MVKCVFCGKEESQFRGTHFIKNDGTVNYFCSGKCRKNALQLKRDRRKVRWTNDFHIKKKKDIAKAKESKK